MITAIYSQTGRKWKESPGVFMTHFQWPTSIDIDLLSIVPFSWHRGISFHTWYLMIRRMVVRISSILSRGHDYVVNANAENTLCFTGLTLRNDTGIIDGNPRPLLEVTSMLIIMWPLTRERGDESVGEGERGRQRERERERERGGGRDGSKKDSLDTETNIRKNNTKLYWGCGTSK